MRRRPAALRRLKAWWGREAVDRFEHGAEGLGSSRADFERLQDLHRRYFRELRAIVAESAPEERVVLASLQLLALDSVSEA